MKAFVISDTHGCLEELKEIIKGIDRTKTRIILVGDLIDRGKDSKGVINFVRNNNIECVQGNHEAMAFSTCISIEKGVVPYSSDWFHNGGEEVYNSYSSKDELVEDLLWLNTLPRYIETGILDEEDKELLVSHAWCRGYSCDHRGAAQSFDFVWNRQQPLTLKDSKFYNIFGHTPVDYLLQRVYHSKEDVIPEPIFYPSGCNIDTGCAYKSKGRGYLTGVFFPSLEVKQVKLKDDDEI